MNPSFTPINTQWQRVECFRRHDEKLWVLPFYTPEPTSFRLDRIGFEGTLDALCEDVVFE